MGAVRAPVVIEDFDDAFAVGEHARVVVLVWRGRPTRARLERSVEAFGSIARRAQAPLSMFAVIEERSPPPAFANLAFSARAFDRFADVLVASVAVLEERSTTSAVLDALSAVNALRRRPAKTKFCADVREAAAWLAPRHPHTEPEAAFRAALIAAVEAVRASFSA